MKNTTNMRCSRHLAILSLLVSLLLIGSHVILVAEEEPIHPQSGQSTSVPTVEESRALLPSIQRQPPDISHLALPKGIDPGIIGSIPGEPPHDPDEFKVLYGYSGPYYNTSRFDGQVSVIKKSLYAWPVPTWKVSGMLRNQTRQNIHIAKIVANLFGSTGVLLFSATTTPPVTELRPGEPAPFVIEAPLSRSDVAIVEWNVAYVTTPGTSHFFTFDVYEEGKVLNDSRYDLVGSVYNISTTTVRDVRVVVAWLDSQGRVLFIDSPKIHPITNQKDARGSADLPGSGSTNFDYITTDGALISLLGDSGIALWSTSN